MIKKEKIVDREEDHNKLYRGIMDKVIDGKGSVSSPTKKNLSLNGSKKSLKKGFEAVLLYVVLVCISLAIIFIAVQVYSGCVK